MFGWEALIDLIAASLRMGSPLVLAAMGGLLAERSGVVNIALEGKMLFGALIAAVVAYGTQSPWLGALAAGLVGTVMALGLGVLCLETRAQPIIAGTALNMTAAGLCPLLAFALYGVTGSTPTLPPESRLESPIIFVAWFLPWIIWLFFRLFYGGMWIHAAGENPEALAAVGKSPRKIRYGALGISGFLTALGGAILSLGLSSAYAREMTAGRGFMALAAVVLGKWNPLGTLGACLFFGLVEAMQMRLQSLAVLQIPSGILQIFPYLATLLVLLVGVGPMRPPKALSQG
jgi:ABC-type uncharacterized transport system permease subunit